MYWHRLRGSSTARALVALTLVLGVGAGLYTVLTPADSDSPSDRAVDRAGVTWSDVPRGPSSSSDSSVTHAPSPTPATDSSDAPDDERSVTPGTTSPSSPPSSEPTTSEPESSPSTKETTPSPDPTHTSRFKKPGDKTPPETTLLQERPAPDAAQFTFSANEAATFTCSLDGAAFRPCSSPGFYDHLKPGWHTFAVVAKDKAGNVDPSPATARWKVRPAKPHTDDEDG